MSIRSDDKSSNGNIVTEDSYYKVCADVKLLMDRLKIVKYKLKNTPWYRILTRIKLRKELSRVEKESEEVGKRLIILDAKSRNPIQIVKRI